MKRWFFKRWTWAGIFGITAAVGLALGAGKEAPSGPPKIGDVTTLKFQNGPDKQVKVLKAEKQADGSYQMEVKDLKSGEVFTLIDRTHEPAANPKTPANGKAAPMGAKAAAIKPPESIKTVETKKVADPKVMKGADFSPSAKARFSDPMLPNDGPAPDVSKERRVFTPTKPNTVATPTPMPEPMADTQKKPGVIGRLFGRNRHHAAAPTTPVARGCAHHPAGSNTTAKRALTAKPAPMFMPQTWSEPGGRDSTGAGTDRPHVEQQRPEVLPGQAGTAVAPRGRRGLAVDLRVRSARTDARAAADAAVKPVTPPTPVSRCRSSHRSRADERSVAAADSDSTGHDPGSGDADSGTNSCSECDAGNSGALDAGSGHPRCAKYARSPDDPVAPGRNVDGPCHGHPGRIRDARGDGAGIGHPAARNRATFGSGPEHASNVGASALRRPARLDGDGEVDPVHRLHERPVAIRSGVLHRGVV